DSSVWSTTAGSVAGWWRARASLRIETLARANELTVLAHNRGALDISGAVAHVALPTLHRVQFANVRLLRAQSGHARLALPNIPAGKTLRFTLRFAHNTTAPAPVRPSSARRPWWEFWRRR
ncbi:MAG: hypothetical protein ACREMA_20675, partial [Longimicrobiales bacterium]